MPVQKFRSIEQMASARILAAPGEEGIDRFLRHCARMIALSPRAYPRGVFKFRRLEDAQSARHRAVRRLALAEQGDDEDIWRRAPEERIAMMWQLALQAWMFKEGLIDEPRLRRDVVRVVRGRR